MHRQGTRTDMRAGLIACLTAILSAAPVQGDEVDWRDYKVYYTTFPSTLVPPEVAELHDITRGESRILTNVTVRRSGESVQASVTGTVTNLLNQMTTLEFREVIEEAAVYYLANQLVDEKDTLRYRLEIRPAGENDAFELEFTRRYSGATNP